MRERKSRLRSVTWVVCGLAAAALSAGCRVRAADDREAPPAAKKAGDIPHTQSSREGLRAEDAVQQTQRCTDSRRACDEGVACSCAYYHRNCEKGPIVDRRSETLPSGT